MAAMMWPTPNVPNGGRRVPDNAEINGGNTPTNYLNGKKMHVCLEQAVKWWPTPTKSDGCGGPGCSGREGGMNLRTAVTLPTPCSQDAKNSTLPISQRDRDSIPGHLLRSGEKPGGQLNPTWVEWLMGWPLGWTDLQPLEMDKFQYVRLRLGVG
jgi:hypothetical protein